MKFTEFEMHSWQNMIKAIKRYQSGHMTYADIIYDLEGYLDMGDFKNKELILEWYDHWTPLEILYSCEGNSMDDVDFNSHIENMKRFLCKQL